MESKEIFAGFGVELDAPGVEHHQRTAHIGVMSARNKGSFSDPGMAAAGNRH